MTTTINASTSAGLVQTADTSGVLALQTAGTTAVTVDASQNVGIGVTPSSWSLSGGKALELSGGSLDSYSTTYLQLAQNAYYNGTNWIYKNTAGATLYQQGASSHVWQYAASGTAGNTVTFTTGMTIDSSGNVGIGITPSTWTGTKAIEVGSLGTALWSSGAGSTTLSNGAYYNSGWKYANATSKPSILDFDNAGKVTYYAATATSTAGSAISLTQLLAVEAGKSLALQGATTQTGTGITFPATQSASTDVNTLDDYEEGTWTPTVASGTGSITAYNASGQYRKVGGLVSLQFYYQITNNGTGSGSINVSNLPFANTIGSNTSAGVIREIAVTGLTGSLYFQSTTNLLLVNYNNGYPGGLNNYYICSVCYYA